jgi:hypothetical protein
MRKFYPAILAVIVCTLCFSNTQAQRKIGKLQQAITKPHINGEIKSTQGTTADCDTINYPISDTWSATGFYVSNDHSQGFINGSNSFGDRQKANFFDLSATTNNYILSTYVAFAFGNSSNAANLSKKVFFRVYADSAGVPGPLLGTAEDSLANIKIDVDSSFLTSVSFTSPIQLPDSKKIYVSVDFSNLSWPTDTIFVYSTNVDEDIPGLAWEQWKDSSWHAFSDTDLYNSNITLWIFPVVSATATGCATLPVKLISFDAQRNNKDVTLNWQIADEFGMKGYEVERSDNNGGFKTVANVAAFNNAKNQSYSATDKNAFTISPTVQYRLKQIDGDGSVKYSRVISVKSASSISDISFANPFNGALKMQLNLATAQPVTAYLYDMQGKLVANEKTKMYNAASNTIIMTSTANLQRGIYVLKVIAGTDQAVYKVVKE